MVDDSVHRKPIGENGPIRVACTNGGPVLTWEKVAYPGQKVAQEAMIADAFLRKLNAIEGEQWALKQLPEADFDFTIYQGSDERYLELQEIVIPPKKRGSPYADREQVVQSVKFSETILSSVGKKAAKYPRNAGKPLELLLYVTHWRFLTIATVHKLLAFWFLHHQHPFSRVHVFTKLGEISDALETVFPATYLVAGFTPAMASNHRYVNVDPAGWQLTNRQGSVGAGFTLPSATLNKLFGR
jgi:hypothetical protein